MRTSPMVLENGIHGVQETVQGDRDYRGPLTRRVSSVSFKIFYV